MPFYQELTDEKNNGVMHSTNIITNLGRVTLTESRVNEHRNTQMSVLDNFKILDCSYEVPFKGYRGNPFDIQLRSKSSPSTIIVESNKQSLSFFNKCKYGWKTSTSIINLPIRHTSNVLNTGLFGIKDTAVYMTLSDAFCRLQSSSTQATASINKCFQVSNEWLPLSPSTNATSTDYCSSCTISTLPYHRHKKVMPAKLGNANIYFFGRKKDVRKQKGMGSQTRLHKTSQTSTHAFKSENTSDSNTSLKIAKPRYSKGAATASSAKTVTIQDEKQLKPCPAKGGIIRGDMMVTVSHIRIGPKETCPIHGNEPCQGPKCVLASSGEEQGPVKVTSVNNPRRGVFEIVIRKLTGKPLAKNELMLEWTPPPSRPPTCNGPWPTPCLPPGSYRPSKCKLIVCRPSPCKPKCCKKKPCGRPCRPSQPCQKCCRTPSCGNPCNPCTPCPPPSCCPPAPCKPPCGRPACTPPCKSSPCLRPCPVGRKRHRKSRSLPRIKSHRKKISPCCNRSRTCPVVRCRSVPEPCIGCCFIPPICLPRKCCSVGRCKPPC